MLQVMEELKQYFRPEFLNRLDEIIVFRQLTKSEVKQIADIMLKGVVERAKEKEITIDLTERYSFLSLDDSAIAICLLFQLIFDDELFWSSSVCQKLQYLCVRKIQVDEP